MKNRYASRHSGCLLGLLLAGAMLAGCQEEEGIKRYTARRPDEPERPVKYQLPNGWEKAPLAQFSIATFRVTDGDQKAEISISPFAGDGGGLLANVNRWRTKQLNLPEVTEEQMRKDLKDFGVDGQKGQAVDLIGPAGEKQERILAVIVARDDKTWIFRIRGPADLVDKQKKAFFDEFMGSVRFGGGRGGKNG